MGWFALGWDLDVGFIYCLSVCLFGLRCLLFELICFGLFVLIVRWVNCLHFVIILAGALIGLWSYVCWFGCDLSWVDMSFAYLVDGCMISLGWLVLIVLVFCLDLVVCVLLFTCGVLGLV